MKRTTQFRSNNRRPAWLDPHLERELRSMLFWTDALLHQHAERTAQLQSQGLPRSAAALLAFQELQPAALPRRRARA